MSNGWDQQHYGGGMRWLLIQSASMSHLCMSDTLVLFYCRNGLHVSHLRSDISIPLQDTLSSSTLLSITIRTPTTRAMALHSTRRRRGTHRKTTPRVTLRKVDILRSSV